MRDAKIIRVREMCSDLNSASIDHSKVMRGAIYLYNHIITHHFVEITLKGADNFTYTWLMQIDQAGIKQWFGINWLT